MTLEERHFRYAGILFFLLLLTAVDQWGVRFAKGLAWFVVIVLGFYGLKSFRVTGAYAQMRTGYYDPMTKISQDFVPPAILEYMRSEVTRNNFQHSIAVVDSSTSAALSLPQFRILYFDGLYLTGGQWPFLKMIAAPLTWAGRAEKIFVVVSEEEMLLDGRAEAILRSFTDYEFKDWSQMKLDGIIIYTQ